MSRKTILLERFHLYMEQSLCDMFPEWDFISVSDQPHLEVVGLRHNSNFVFWRNVPWDRIDACYLVSKEAIGEAREHGKPFLLHVSQFPLSEDQVASLRNAVGSDPVRYYSPEEAAAWEIGTPHIIPYSLNPNFWQGYTGGSKRRGIFTSSHSLDQWPDAMKGYILMQQIVAAGVPMRIIDSSQGLWPDSGGPLTRGQLVEEYRESYVYANTAWKLDKSAFEAMLTGMPVISIVRKLNWRDRWRNGENIILCDTVEEMVSQATHLLSKKQERNRIGSAGRETAMELFCPVNARVKIVQALFPQSSLETVLVS